MSPPDWDSSEPWCRACKTRHPESYIGCHKRKVAELETELQAAYKALVVNATASAEHAETLQEARHKLSIELNTLAAAHADLRAAALAVGHHDDCPAIERLQPDRRTMSSNGPCNCWRAPLRKALDK